MPSLPFMLSQGRHELEVKTSLKRQSEGQKDGSKDIPTQTFERRMGSAVNLGGIWRGWVSEEVSQGSS